jgi:hypothetical protein
MKEFIGLGTLPLFFLLFTSACLSAADLLTLASMSAKGTVQSFVNVLSGSGICGEPFAAFAAFGGRFDLGLGDLDLRLVSGFVLVNGEPKDLPLLVRITSSYPVVGGVCG